MSDDASLDDHSGAEGQVTAFTWPIIVLGGVALFGLVGLTVAGVIYRYGFNAPIFGLEDLAKTAMGAFVACGVAYAAVKSSHIAVDTVVKLLPVPVQTLTAIVIEIVGIILCAFVAYALVTSGSCGRSCGKFTANLAISHVPIYYALAAAFAVYGLALIGSLYRRISSVL